MKFIVHGFLAMTAAVVAAAFGTFFGIPMTLPELSFVFIFALIASIYHELKDASNHEDDID